MHLSLLHGIGHGTGHGLNLLRHVLQTLCRLWQCLRLILHGFVGFLPIMLQ